MRKERNVIAYWNDAEPWYLTATPNTIKKLEKMGARVEIIE